MSKLISGKEAAIAWLDDLEIQIQHQDKNWEDFSPYYFGLEVFKSNSYQFRLKPRTIKINGIEVPAPFKPKEGEEHWVLFDSSHSSDGYKLVLPETHSPKASLGKWRTEDEIKQVVAALRKVFGVQP